MPESSIIKQSKNFFSKLNTVQRILIIGAPVALVIALITILSITGDKQMSVLFSGLEAPDAAKIVESLKAQNISYKLDNNGATILVDKSKVLETRINLAGEGLPEQSVVGYELFDKTNLGMSEFVQKLNYRRALEGELAKTIVSIDEVKKARVHIVIPDKVLFDKDQKKPTASVTLHLKSGKNISQKSIQGIQTIVAASVEGMLTEDVSIVDHKGKLISESAVDANSAAGLTAQQLEQQKKTEDNLTQKVQSLLDGVLGVDNSSVRVNVELDFTRSEQTKTDYDPEKQVVRSEQTRNESNKSTDSLSYPAVSMDKNQSNIIQNYEISSNIEHIIHSVGGIKRLSVAAMINGDTKIQDSNGKKTYVYVPKTEKDMQQLTDIIKNSVGFDPLRNDQISVINVPFETMLDNESIEKLNPPLWWNNRENQKLFLLLAAIIVTIILMYRLLQSKQLKDKIRIAMELPNKIEIKDDEEVEEEDDKLEDINIDEDELLLMPAELPEQFLLEGDRQEQYLEENPELLDRSGYESTEFLSKAKKRFDISTPPELTEDTMMKIEIKQKVEEFIDTRTEEATRLFRILLSQDNEEKLLKK
jgi:flagellar M-ring protein FliF